MKHLEKIASEYAQRNFPVYEAADNSINANKNDIAYRSFCDGFNEAMRILMDIGNIKYLDKRIEPFNFIDVDE